MSTDKPGIGLRMLVDTGLYIENPTGIKPVGFGIRMGSNYPN